MTKPITEMTPDEMDAFASQVYATLIVTEQEAEAKAVYRLGEFIRELGRRLGRTDTHAKNRNVTSKAVSAAVAGIPQKAPGTAL